MNKFVLASAMMLCSATMIAQNAKDAVMTKSKDTYTINTTTLCNTRGYKSSTPLTVVIKKDKIEKIEALPNKETPKFFDRLRKEMFPKYKGVTFDEADKVDCITGATMSSKAVKDHVKAAIEHYKANK